MTYLLHVLIGDGHEYVTSWGYDCAHAVAKLILIYGSEMPVVLLQCSETIGV